MIDKICPVCKEKFTSHESAKKIYCSRKCYFVVFAQRQKGANNPHWKDVNDKKIVDMYVNEKRSQRYIYKKLGIAESAVRLRLKMAGVKKRSFKESVRLGEEQSEIWQEYFTIDPNSKTGNRKIYLEIAKKHFPWKCMKCGIRKSPRMDLIVHHIDENTYNNDIKNLMVLCQGCHYDEHHPILTLKCVVCGKDIKTRAKHRKYCSDRCWHDSDKMKEHRLKKNEKARLNRRGVG